MKQVQYLLDGDAAVTEENEAATRNRKQTGELSLSEVLKNLGSVISLKPLEAKPSEEGQRYKIPPRVTVWFNAWKYQTSEQIWAGLAHCIISQVAARMDARSRELFWLKLHARRINKEALRRKSYELVVRHLAPLFLVLLIASVGGVWAAYALAAKQIPLFVSYPWLTKAAAPVLSAITLVWKGRQKLGEKAADVFKELVREPDYEGKMGFLYLVESDIRDVLDLVARKEAPLVIFVDDLDRCVPHKVAEVVEAINLSLSGDYPNCIFVLGMEPGMVAACLQVANKDVIETAKQLSLLDSPVPLGWRFMEKIIQLPVTIPPPTGTGVEQYMHSLVGAALSAEPANIANGQTTDAPQPLDEAAINEWMKRFQQSKSVGDVVNRTNQLLTEAGPEEKLAVAEASKRKYAETFSDRDPAVGKFVDQVVKLVDSNPRQIKRYINVFRFYSTLRHNFQVDSAARGITVTLPSDSALAKFIALSIQWPHAIDTLRMTGRVNGRKDGVVSSLLGELEEKSRNVDSDESKADTEWLTFLKSKGVMIGAFGDWVTTRTFRQFLAEGESLSQLERCGLW
jgi:hypothetical protein